MILTNKTFLSEFHITSALNINNYFFNSKKKSNDLFFILRLPFEENNVSLFFLEFDLTHLAYNDY